MDYQEFKEALKSEVEAQLRERGMEQNVSSGGILCFEWLKEHSKIILDRVLPKGSVMIELRIALKWYRYVVWLLMVLF